MNGYKVVVVIVTYSMIGGFFVNCLQGKKGTKHQYQSLTSSKNYTNQALNQKKHDETNSRKELLDKFMKPAFDTGMTEGNYFEL